jgi:hypothetical protein
MAQKVMYKLVSQNYTSHNGTKWEVGKEVVAQGAGKEMCTNQVLHCYSNKYLAIIFNPLHANIQNPRLIKVKCDKIVASDGLKFACKKQTMIGEISAPEITTLQKVEFAIRVAMLQYKASSFISWANNWISGKDRTGAAAESARFAERAAAWSAERAAAWSAAESAESAARSARFAERAAERAAKKFEKIITQIMETSNG